MDKKPPSKPSNGLQFSCMGCGEVFLSGGSWKRHLAHSTRCQLVFTSLVGKVDVGKQSSSHPNEVIYGDAVNTNNDFLDHLNDEDTDEETPPHDVFQSQAGTLRRVCANLSVWSNTQKVEIELLDILKEYNVPLGMYDRIMDWSRSAALRDHDFTIIPRGRDVVVRNLKQVFGLENIAPITSPVSLLHGDSVQVTSFNFKEMLFSLLSDPELMQEENLLLDPTDPCSLPEKSDFLDEINTGSVYRTAHGTCCTKPNDLLCGIIIYVDKTVMGPWTKNTLEPVQFTLAIFNKEARKSHKFWRPLGYIPDLFNRRRVSDVLGEVHGDTIPEGSKHLSPLEKLETFICVWKGSFLPLLTPKRK